MKNAKAEILRLLKDAGQRGSLTWELITQTHCSAAARRVWDLQQEGHRIRKVKEGVGIYRWIYDGPPAHRIQFKQLSLIDVRQQIREA